jgi:hypothetical protein
MEFEEGEGGGGEGWGLLGLGWRLVAGATTSAQATWLSWEDAWQLDGATRYEVRLIAGLITLLAVLLGSLAVTWWRHGDLLLQVHTHPELFALATQPATARQAPAPAPASTPAPAPHAPSGPPESGVREMSAFELPPPSGSVSVAPSAAASSVGGFSEDAHSEAGLAEAPAEAPADVAGVQPGAHDCSPGGQPPDRPGSAMSDVSASWAAGRLHRDSLDADARIWSAITPATDGEGGDGRLSGGDGQRRLSHGHTVTEGDLRPLDPTLTPSNQIRTVLLAKINLGVIPGVPRPGAAASGGGIAFAGGGVGASASAAPAAPPVAGGVAAGGAGTRSASKRSLPQQWLVQSTRTSSAGSAPSSPASQGPPGLGADRVAAVATAAAPLARQASPAGTVGSLDSTRPSGGGHGAAPSWMGDEDGGMGDGY